MDEVKFEQDFGLSIARNRGVKDEFKTPQGRFKFELFDKDGKKKAEGEFDNGVTNGGRDDILNVYFNSGTQKTTWYLALIDNSGFSALAAGDTMASHSGWTEFVSYSGGARPTWTSGSSSGQSVTNASAVTFNITGSGTVYGIFVTSNNTLSGTTGTLWSTGAFTSTVPVSNGDQLISLAA